MDVTCRTPVKLVVTHKEPTTRIVFVPLCLAFILLAPVILPVVMPQIEGFPGIINLVFISAFFMIITAAVYIARYHETYTFDKAKQVFIIERISPFGSKKSSGHLRQIEDVYQESYDDNDAIKEYVLLVLAPSGQHLRLPVKLYTFSAEEREQFGKLLCSFLEMPVRVIQK